MITRSASSSAASSPIAARDQADAGFAPAAEREDRRAEPAGRAGAGQLRPARAGRWAGRAPGRRRTAPARRRAAARPRGWRPSAARRRCWRRAARSAGCPRRWRRPARRPATVGPPPSAGDGGQRGAAVRQGVAGAVQRRGAERGQHPGAAVVGRGAAEPDTTRRAPASTAAVSEQAQAVRRGGLRIPLGLGEQVQAARLALSTYAVPSSTTSTSPPTGRPSGSRWSPAPGGRPAPRRAPRRTRARRRPAAGVPDRRPGRRPARPRPPRPPRERSKRPGELVRTDQYAHPHGSAVWQPTAPDRVRRGRRRWDHGGRDVDLDRTRQHRHRPAPAGPGHRPASERASTARATCPPPSDPDLVARATAAKAALGDRVFVLGHHYQRDEVIQFADVTGDSFKLAREAAARPEAEFIVFCGVHFMAESADILTADAQKVILPDLAAGCSMADMAVLGPGRDGLGALRGRWASPRRRVPVTYMNSSADIKGFVGRNGGVVCTSSNAEARPDLVVRAGPRGVLPARPAPGPQHGRARDGLRPRRLRALRPAQAGRRPHRSAAARARR